MIPLISQHQALISWNFTCNRYQAVMSAPPACLVAHHSLSLSLAQHVLDNVARKTRLRMLPCRRHDEPVSCLEITTVSRLRIRSDDHGQNHLPVMTKRIQILCTRLRLWDSYVTKTLNSCLDHWPPLNPSEQWPEASLRQDNQWRRRVCHWVPLFCLCYHCDCQNAVLF